MSGPRSTPAILITGGAGFVGANLAHHLLGQGARVRIFDALARAGSERNARWLGETHADIEIIQGDVRDCAAVALALDGVDHVFHLAAQVAVTTSLLQPRCDFDVNAAGTLNVLEAARACAQPPSVVFSSTNKVYGVLPDIEVRAVGKRYVPIDEQLHARGVSEDRPLDFHSPYGCSKGAAEQYVLDYARSFGLRTLVLRMSCIYGPHQYGNEDQGWVAHFVRRALADEPVTIYGDGMQVRDVLFIDDLVDAFERAWRSIESLRGQAFNIGGGVANTVSILELLHAIEQRTGRSVRTSFDSWRVGDQRFYVSDVRRFGAATGWRPSTDFARGFTALCDWFELSPPGAGAHRTQSGFAAAEAHT